MVKNNSKYFFWLFTCFLIVILVLPNLLKHGMFMDGLLYSTVANNFAHGKGTFWHLYNTDTLHRGFYEQPPLYFWIMAGFYKIFGDSIFVERFYDFVMLLLSAFLIHKNWQVLVPCKFSRYSFLPVLFWIMTPVCFWAYSNNMLEISVSVFALSSSFFLFKYYFREPKGVYLIIAGFFLIAGGLTKGFVALFPLVIPFFYYLLIRRFSLRKWFFDSVLLSVIPVFVIVLIFLFETSRSGFTIYLTQRVFHSITSVSTVDNRFHILGRLASELLPVVLLNLLIFGIRRISRRKNGKLFFDRKFFFLFLIALFASVPLMVTKEQRGFYLVTSLSYYALSIAWLLIPVWQKMVNYLAERKWLKKRGHIIGAFLIIIALLFSGMQVGKYNRDEEVLKDIEVLKPILKNKKLISVNTKLWERWNIHSYFMRSMGVSLDTKSKWKYFLTEKNKMSGDSTYKKVEINTTFFDLFKKSDVEK